MSKGLEKGPGHEKNFKGGDNVKEHISVIRFAIFPPCCNFPLPVCQLDQAAFRRADSLGGNSAIFTFARP